MQTEDVMDIIEKVIGKRLDRIGEQLSDLNNEVSNMHGAHNQQLKSLEDSRDKFEVRLSNLENQLKEINPRLQEERYKTLLEKMSELRIAIDDNRQKNQTQDDRWQDTLLGVIKWAGVILAAALGGWLLKHIT